MNTSDLTMKNITSQKDFEQKMTNLYPFIHKHESIFLSNIDKGLPINSLRSNVRELLNDDGVFLLTFPVPPLNPIEEHALMLIINAYSDIIIFLVKSIPHNNTIVWTLPGDSDNLLFSNLIDLLDYYKIAKYIIDEHFKLKNIRDSVFNRFIKHRNHTLKSREKQHGENLSRPSTGVSANTLKKYNQSGVSSFTATTILQRFGNGVRKGGVRRRRNTTKRRP